MELLLKRDINKNNFNIFIRDLCQGQNINLKHMIEDLFIKEKNNLLKNKNYNKRKNVPRKKKDIIIEEQNAKRKQKKIE